MNKFFPYLGSVAIAGLCFAGGVSSARADQILDCEMKGRWVEPKEDWTFSAKYTSKEGPDSFTGIFSNPKAGATANVDGFFSEGTWNIRFAYTDVSHPGWVNELIGTGTKDARHILTVKGNFVLKKRGKVTKKGTFTLIGTCKPK